LSETFCQICRHPTPGHEPSCPVGTGEPVRGLEQIPQALFSCQEQIQGQAGQLGSGLQAMQAMPCPICGGINGRHVWAGAGMCPGVSMLTSGSDDRDRLLAELKTLVQVNKRLTRELLECRMELEALKARALV